jgi:hypothetical protein
MDAVSLHRPDVTTALSTLGTYGPILQRNSKVLFALGCIMLQEQPTLLQQGEDRANEGATFSHNFRQKGGSSGNSVFIADTEQIFARASASQTPCQTHGLC